MSDAVTIFRYDNAENPCGILPYISAEHEEDLDGTDMLTVVSEVIPNKRDRLVWQDGAGTWHEHIVDATVTEHVNGKVLTTSTCSNSISELYGFVMTGAATPLDPYGQEGEYYGNAFGMLEEVLKGTRWCVDECDSLGAATIEIWCKSARQCIAEICELLGGEMTTRISVGEKGVLQRYVGIVAARGSTKVERRFSYGQNMTSCRREVAQDEVYTKVDGVGAVTDPESPYIERTRASYSTGANLSLWGVMGRVSYDDENEMTTNGNADTYVDALTDFSMPYVDDSCTDASFLLTQCIRQRQVVENPLIRYEFDIADVDGGAWENVQLGDAVSIVDEPMGINLIERVSHIKRNLSGTMEMRVCIGKRADFIAEKFTAAEKNGHTQNGNNSRVTANNATTTGGTFGGSGDGASHTLDGSPITGTIAFTSVASGS